MSAYVTATMLAGRLKASYSRLYALPADQADLDRDLTAVGGLVDSYLGQRYTVPVADAQALTVVQALALDLAEEIAWRRASGTEIPAKVKDAATTARQTLEKMGAGKLSLAGAAAAESDAAGAAGILVSGQDPQFTRDQLAGY